MESAGNLFKLASNILNKLPKHKYQNVDEIEVIFIDIINNKMVSSRAFTFMDVLRALELGSKPVGLLLLYWDSPEDMKVLEFPDLTIDEQSCLIGAFAEAQDQIINDKEIDTD